MDYYSKVRGYILNILIPIWLSIFIILFSCFGETYKKVYKFTFIILMISSILLIIKYIKENKFYFDLKKGVISKQHKKAILKDIKKIIIIKRGMISTIKFIFDSSGVFLLTKGFKTADISDFLYTIKEYNRTYKIENKRKLSLYILPSILVIIYGVIYLNLSIFNTIGVDYSKRNINTSIYTYGRYKLFLPKEYDYANTNNGFDIYINKYFQKVIKVGRIPKIEKLYNKGYLKYIGIESYTDFFYNLKNNKFSLFYNYLINKFDIEEYSEHNYKNIKAYTFYSSKQFSILIFLDEIHPTELNIISITGVSKEEFYNTAFIISRGLAR